MPRTASGIVALVGAAVLCVVAATSGHAGMGIGATPAPAAKSGLANPPGDSVIQKKKGPAVKDGVAKGDGSVKGAVGKVKP